MEIKQWLNKLIQLGRACTSDLQIKYSNNVLDQNDLIKIVCISPILSTKFVRRWVMQFASIKLNPIKPCPFDLLGEAFGPFRWIHSTESSAFPLAQIFQLRTKPVVCANYRRPLLWLSNSLGFLCARVVELYFFCTADLNLQNFGKIISKQYNLSLDRIQ